MSKNSLNPADEAPKLRAFCARNCLSQTAIARRLGVHKSYVSRVLRADETEKAVSDRQLERIWSAAFALAREREGARA